MTETFLQIQFLFLWLVIILKKELSLNTLNLNVGGDFSNNDSANDFTWGENDILTVLGSADIATNNFANDGNIFRYFCSFCGW